MILSADLVQMKYRNLYIRRNFSPHFCFSSLFSIYISSDNKAWSCRGKVDCLGDLSTSAEELNDLIKKRNLSTISSLSLDSASGHRLCYQAYQFDPYKIQTALNDLYELTQIEVDLNGVTQLDEIDQKFKRLTYLINLVPTLKTIRYLDFTKNHHWHVSEIQRQFPFLSQEFENLNLSQLTFDTTILKTANAISLKTLGSDFDLGQFYSLSQVASTTSLKVHLTFSAFVQLVKNPPAMKLMNQPNMTLVFEKDASNDGLLTSALAQISNLKNLTPKLATFFLTFAESMDTVEFAKISLQIKLDLKDRKKKRLLTCTLPFTQLSIYPDGSLKPCCWLLDYKLNEKNDAEFTKDWNSVAAQNLRRQFTSGPVTICQEKMEKVSCHTRNPFPDELIEFENNLTRPPAKLHWYFSGRCNLECQTCHNWHFKNEFPESDLYWTKLKSEIFPHLSELEIVGGEPFYQARTFQLIKTVSELNPLCNWYITTNGQFKFEGAIKEHLDLIHLAYFSVSIDSLKSINFAKIRKNGQLEKSLNFLDDLIIYNENLPVFKRFKPMINFVLQKDNWSELEDFLKFAESKKVDLHIIPMIDPAEFSVYSLEKHDFHKLLKQVNDLAGLYNNKYLLDLKSDLSRNSLRNQFLESSVDL